MNKEILVHGPERWQGQPELAADIMIGILETTYVKHNITNNRDQLVADIRVGTLLPWITDDESACAALIVQSDTDVEIGRAACMTAVTRWKEGEVFPNSQMLRAEIRTAKPTRRIPGGQATQAIFLKILGFFPTAMGPFFHHGDPDQQEMFLLAHWPKDGHEILKAVKKVVVPKVVLSDVVERKIVRQFWKMTFGCELQTADTDGGGKCDFAVQDVGPFLVLTPSKNNLNDWRNSVSGHFNHGHRFALARLNLTKMEPPDISTGAISLRQAGFHLVGFEPVLIEGQWNIDLLMGKLSSTGRTNLVMPSFTEGVVCHGLEDNLLQVAINWRQNG